MRGRVTLFALLLITAAATRAAAQIDDAAWGLSAGFTPRWLMPGELMSGVFDADLVDLQGTEFKVGVVRGTTAGGEWGVSMLHKRFRKDSDIQLSGDHGRAIFVTEDAEMVGVEGHRFFPFARILGGTSIGVNLAIGVARIRGVAQGEYTIAAGGFSSQQTKVLTPEVFDFVGREITWLPVGKAELAVAVPIGDRVKIRVGGGLNFPGFQVVGVSLSYLTGHDR